MVNAWFDLNRGKGKHLKIFNPTKDYCSHYNPYDSLKLGGEDNLIQNAHDLALSILPTPPNAYENRVWIKLAQNLLTGAILYYYGIGATFNQTMLAVHNYSVKELVRKIMGSDNENAKFELMHSKENSAKMFDPFIKSAFCTEEETDVINWGDFNSDEKVYDVILQIPESKLEQWEAMTSLMLNQLIKTLEQRADKHSALGKKLPPILILLDEFPRLGICHAIKNGLATLRSRGVTFALFIQNLAQLDERYGVDGRRDILGCCSYKDLLNVTEPDDQEYFSRLIGTVKTGQRSFGANFTPNNELLGYNMNISEARERIFEPEELGTFEKDFILITPRGFCRIDKASFYDKRCRELLIPPPLPPFTLETFGYDYNPSTPLNDWGNHKNVETWRQEWANECNHALARSHVKARVTHESYVRQGLDRKPQIHLGRKVCALEQRGIHTERGNQNRDIIEQNRLLDERQRSKQEYNRDSDLYRYR